MDRSSSSGANERSLLFLFLPIFKSALASKVIEGRRMAKVNPITELFFLPLFLYLVFSSPFIPLFHDCHLEKKGYTAAMLVLYVRPHCTFPRLCSHLPSSEVYLNDGQACHEEKEKEERRGHIDFQGSFLG